MRIVCISDLHGNLPDIPEGDLCIIGGDILLAFPFMVFPQASRGLHQAKWLDRTFRPWLESLKMPVIATAGNHDFVFQDALHLVPDLPWTVLLDQAVTFNGLKIYGSPWQLRFGDWAFNLDESDLVDKWAAIPDDTEVLLLHGPPRGYGDKTENGEHVGSPSLLRRIEEVSPRLVVFGHVHPGAGRYDHYDIPLVNASLVNSQYEPVNQIIVVDI